MLRCMEKWFSDHDIFKKLFACGELCLPAWRPPGDRRLEKVLLGVKMAEAMPALAKYPGYVTAFIL